MSTSVNPRILSARGRKASLSRSRPEDDPELVSAGRDLAAAKLEQYIEKIVSTAPPLTSAQKSRLSALIGGAG